MDASSKSLLVPTNAYGGRGFKRGSVVFYHDSSIVDALIRIFSGSYYTHVGVALGDGKTICAWNASNGGVCTWYGDGAQGSIPVEARPFPGDAEALIASMEKYVGHPYDLAGWPANPLWNLLGMFGKRITMSGGPPATFHCSSLIAYCWPNKTWNKPYRAVTPQDIYNAVTAGKP